MTSELPAFAVRGVESLGGTRDPRGVNYRVAQLAACPPVAAAIDRVPAVMPAISSDVPAMREAFAVPRDVLLAELGVITVDGRRWTLSFRDAVAFIVDVEVLRQALAGQPGIDSVGEADVDGFDVRMDRLRRADEMAAGWLGVIVAAHREYARTKDIDLPY